MRPGGGGEACLRHDLRAALQGSGMDTWDLKDAAAAFTSHGIVSVADLLRDFRADHGWGLGVGIL
jgi:hypothetical protein